MTLLKMTRIGIGVGAFALTWCGMASLYFATKGQWLWVLFQVALVVINTKCMISIVKSYKTAKKNNW